MNLRNAKKVVITIQEALELDPCTAPEREFRAELYYLAHSKGNHMSISSIEDGRIHPDDSQIGIPCTIITISGDDTFDGPTSELLSFTYYNGDSTPSGQHHALMITDLTTNTLLYRRKRGQNPASQWDVNFLAEGKPDFVFTPYVSDREWMTREKYCKRLQNLKADKFIGTNSSMQFLIETAYLNFWNIEHSNIPNEDGISFNCVFDKSEDEDGLNQALLTVTCDNHDEIEPLMFVYIVDPKNGEHSLMLMDGDNVVYERNIGQNEATEWLCNCMANDPLITDETGDTLFIGEPFRE